jgi:hypothetical protein
MEIVGLLIVVILIVMIIFFSLTFRTLEPVDDRIITFQEKEIARQLGPVMAETTIMCDNRKIKVREIILDCATTRNINCNGQNSCYILNETTKKMINETIAKEIDYSVQITKLNQPIINPQQLIINHTTGACLNPKFSEQFTTPIGAGNLGALTIIVKACY